MKTMPEQYVTSYKESCYKAVNRLLRKFATDFCKEDGNVDWKNLLSLISEINNKGMLMYENGY